MEMNGVVVARDAISLTIHWADGVESLIVYDDGELNDLTADLEVREDEPVIVEPLFCSAL
jgi:hypothetical protein